MDLEFRNLNVLIGPNGAGKSNLVQFFRFVERMVTGELQAYVAERGGAERLLHFGSKLTKSISASLEFEPNDYSFELSVGDDDRLFFRTEVCGINTSSRIWRLAKTGDRESGLLSRILEPVPYWVKNHIREWRVYHFHDTGDTAQIKKPSRVDDNRKLRSDAGNLAAFLYRLRDTQSYSQIVATIRLIAPYFSDFVLHPLESKPELIKLEWRHVGSDQYFDATDFSDGTLRFICLVVLFLQPNPPTAILLDEPELGLHPFALNLLASLMHEASKRTQIICTTQSVPFLSSFAPDDVIVVERDDQQSSFRRLDVRSLQSWLSDYSLGELWEKNLIGGLP